MQLTEHQMNRTNMGVQRTATRRNRFAEKVSHFILQSAIAKLEAEKLVQLGWDLRQQHLFESDLTRDRWDHHVRLGLGNPPQDVEVWGQTTCYKGHDDGATEANKTYEVRETITEALCLRAASSETNSIFLVHITFGNPDYVYSWFRPMKETVFDVSIYIHDNSYDVFEAIDEVLGDARTETQEKQNLEAEVNAQSLLGLLIVSAVSKIFDALKSTEQSQSKLGPLQAALITENLKLRKKHIDETQDYSGENIKKSVVDFILSESGIGFSHSIVEAAEEILTRKPFLRSAKEQLGSWQDFLNVIEALVAASGNLNDLIFHLWTVEDIAIRESVRRILVRLHSRGDIEYAQDFGIPGISEHNLYSGNHSKNQAESLVKILGERIAESGISTSSFMTEISREGKKILRAQLYFEARNGTSNKSSFDHILRDLQLDTFEVKTPREVGIDLTGYHAEITDQRVRPYTNFKVITNHEGKPLCILKAKFFSAAEFDRRCKEEGFVGLSLVHKWTDEGFLPRFNIPLIMCVDMPANFSPPAFSVRKMWAMGWDVVFGIEELKAKLRRVSDHSN